MSAVEVAVLLQTDGFALVDITLEIPVYGTVVSTQISKMTIYLEDGREVVPVNPKERDRILLTADKVIDSFFRTRKAATPAKSRVIEISTLLPVSEELRNGVMDAIREVFELAEVACHGSGMRPGDLVEIITREVERSYEQKNKRKPS